MNPLDNLRLLLIEDHADLAETVIDFLESMGATVDYAADGITGLHLFRTLTFDVVLLDLMLPGMDGYALCREIREQQQNAVPIIMMTARDELGDKLSGFDSGADDYIVKPFELPELVARIRALHNRSQRKVTAEVLTVDDLVLNTGTRVVTRAGSPLAVTPLGFSILEGLMRKAPNIVSREELEHLLWGDSLPESDSLRSQIYKLRKTVDKPFERPILHTVPGVGFRLGEMDLEN